jgi:hypothetical protein
MRPRPALLLLLGALHAGAVAAAEPASPVIVTLVRWPYT